MRRRDFRKLAIASEREAIHCPKAAATFFAPSIVPLGDDLIAEYAFNPETGTTTQGETVGEALANLREATALYLEEFPLVVHWRPLVTTFEVEVRG